MALFSRTKEDTSTKKEQGTPEAKKSVKPTRTLPTDRNLSSTLIKPLITEKAVRKGDQNIYTFVIRKDATKYDVRDAVKALFKVTPVRVNIVNKSPRQFMSRAKGRAVTEKSMKKAYVYLKAGDKIDIA